VGHPICISAIDLFCGAGGLSLGLKQAGVDVVLGIDVDSDCRYPFEQNIGASFVEQDVTTVTGEDLNEWWVDGSVRVLAGCAPCQPFSSYRRGVDTSTDKKWPLLDEFARLVQQSEPDVITMENVPRLGSSAVFARFVAALRGLGYEVSWRVCYGPDFDLPQHRRRLVLVGSRIGFIAVPAATRAAGGYRTVRDTIEGLPPVGSGESDPDDRLHRSRALSPLNLERIQKSKPGGTWKDWPESLRSPCHRKATGASFGNVYARMEWDAPAPTITTQAYNFGTGRFGHPSQDRPITLREAAMLQGFPKDYGFLADHEPVSLSSLCRLIGNAVPPPLGFAVGTAIVQQVAASAERES
jgi:DNA (cytosine-5)-methyltransferase 1